MKKSAEPNTFKLANRLHIPIIIYLFGASMHYIYSHIQKMSLILLGFTFIVTACDSSKDNKKSEAQKSDKEKASFLTDQSWCFANDEIYQSLKQKDMKHQYISSVRFKYDSQNSLKGQFYFIELADGVVSVEASSYDRADNYYQILTLNQIKEDAENSTPFRIVDTKSESSSLPLDKSPYIDIPVAYWNNTRKENYQSNKDLISNSKFYLDFVTHEESIYAVPCSLLGLDSSTYLTLESSENVKKAISDNLKSDGSLDLIKFKVKTGLDSISQYGTFNIPIEMPYKYIENSSSVLFENRWCTNADWQSTLPPRLIDGVLFDSYEYQFPKTAFEAFQHMISFSFREVDFNLIDNKNLEIVVTSIDQKNNPTSQTNLIENAVIELDFFHRNVFKDSKGDNVQYQAIEDVKGSKFLFAIRKDATLIYYDCELLGQVRSQEIHNKLKNKSVSQAFIRHSSKYNPATPGI